MGAILPKDVGPLSTHLFFIGTQANNFSTNSRHQIATQFHPQPAAD